MLKRISATLQAHTLFTAILIGYLALAIGFSIANPIYESTDELHHFRYIRYIQQYQALPEQRFDQPRIQAHHPPLYYVIAAIASSWIAPDHDALYEPIHNPYYGYRYWEINNDNKNQYLHGLDEQWPYQGIVLMVHVARWVNVILGALMVWVTYRIGLTVLRADGETSRRVDKGIAAGAAAIVAFNPQFLFMSGAVNNDVIAGLFGSIVLWQGVHIIRHGLTARRAWGIGIAFSLALMAKFNLAFALPLIELALLMAVWPKRDWRSFVKANIILIGCAAVIAGWWFVRNYQLYGEPTGVQRMNELWGGRDPKESFWLAVSEIPYAWSSLWGRFGYGQIPLPDAIYAGALMVSSIGLVGLIIAFVRRSFDRAQVKRISLVIFSALWFAATLFGYMLSSTAGPMGRFYFPGLSAFGVLLAMGLMQVMQGARGKGQPLSASLRGRFAGARGRGQGVGDKGSVTYYAHLPPPARHLAFGRGTPHCAHAVGAGVAWRPVPGFLMRNAVPLAAFALALVAFFGYFVPAYATPSMIDAGSIKIDHPLNATFDGKAELLGAEVDRTNAQPGDPIQVTLYWRALALMDQSYVEFVHLIDDQGIIVAQRDTWPGRGLYPTTNWQPNQVFADTLYLNLPDAAYAPNVARLQVGLYDDQAVRLSALDSNGRPIDQDAVSIGQVSIAPRAGDRPNPMQSNFGDKVELIGYAMSPPERSILPGEAITVTLYWRSRSTFAADYQVFLNALRPNQRISAQATGKPLHGNFSTQVWQPGQVITDVRVLRFPPTARPGLLDVEVGWFLPQVGRLDVLADDGHVLDSKVLLSKIRVREK
jgi:4-amino-4-deoxy-L-arabinose transferase-like glycosyltransferase